MNDIIMIETFFTPVNKVKTASLDMSSLWDSAKEYFMSKIDQSNPKKSIVDILAPGAIFMIFKAFDHSIIGGIVALAMEYFDISISSILESMCSKAMSLISQDTVTEGEVSQIADSTLQEYNTPVTPEQSKKILKTQSVNQVARLKRAVLLYNIDPIVVTADLFGKGAAALQKGKFSLLSFITKTFKVLISLAFISTGFMVAGDLLKYFTGKPILPKTFQSSPTSSPTSSTTTPTSSTKSWYERTTPTKANIEDMLLRFIKETYNKEDPSIKDKLGFQKIVDEISYFNQGSLGNVTFIPPMFTSKKDIADLILKN